jgi:uncharacterized repeat protein (TIGR03803 family)
VTIVMLAGNAFASGPERAIYRFRGGNDGDIPEASLIADKSGNLYGTTTSGGSSGCGTVFELSPTDGGLDWTETTLYSFLGGTDGCDPQSPLLLDKTGNLYGTTTDGGTSNHGTIFEMLPPAAPGWAWSEVVIYNLTVFNDGWLPFGLAKDPEGNLYGEIGYPNCGTIYELSPPVQGGAWTYTALYNFTCGSDGGWLVGDLVFDNSGNLYGATEIGGDRSQCGGYGCGVVFELKRPKKQGGSWSQSVLYTFICNANCGDHYAGGPFGGVTFDRNGNLFGTTHYGGQDGYGSVFELSPSFHQGGPWTEAEIYSFSCGNDGCGPSTRLIFDESGNLYGSAQSGPLGSLLGEVFEVSPPKQQNGTWTETTLYGFNGWFDGGVWPSALLLRWNGALYGTTQSGGLYGKKGVVFKIFLH